MRKTWAMAAVLWAGCGGAPNPFDTSDLEYDLAVQEQRTTQLKRRAVARQWGPQHGELALPAPERDAWKASVLEIADPLVLAGMERDAEARLKLLDERLASLETHLPVSREDVRHVRALREEEERKLLLIQIRQESLR